MTITTHSTVGIDKQGEIYQAWCVGVAPSIVASKLNLAMSTVLKLYVQFDDQ